MRGKPFEPGQIGNPAGRPLGARTRLNKALIEDLYAEWKEGGRDALKIMRIEEPGQFVRCALATLPREWLIESVTSELSDDELDAQINFIREQLAKTQEPKLIEVKANDGSGNGYAPVGE
jgi:hypothetical protein